MVATAPSYLRWIDIHVLDELLKDTWGRLRYSEDWTTAPAVPPKLDYRWLEVSPRPILVAHAFGEAGLPGQNSLDALKRALEAGLRLLEVDVWLDEGGQLRCHHGPELPAEMRPGECTLRTAAQMVAVADAWLVLDIKTDFESTAAVIVREFSTEASASRLIFQLYSPSDVRHFSSLSTALPLPGPLVTAYRARRSLHHVADNTSRLGIKALTIPLYRSAALGQKRPPGTVLLVHPVHDCTALNRARKLAADGFYLHTKVLPQLANGCGEP